MFHTPNESEFTSDASFLRMGIQTGEKLQGKRAPCDIMVQNLQ